MHNYVEVGFKFTEGDDNLEIRSIHSARVVDGKFELVIRAYSENKDTLVSRLMDMNKHIYADGDFVDNAARKSNMPS